MAVMFGTDFAAEMAAAFAGQLEAGTLHVVTVTLDAHGQSVRSAADTAIEGTVLRWDEKTRVARGYPLEAVQILMIAQGKPRPEKGRDEISMRSQRYRILDVMDGGAEAIWLVAGVKL